MRTRPLPTTVEPRPGESLDSFLVRLAAATEYPELGPIWLVGGVASLALASVVVLDALAPSVATLGLLVGAALVIDGLSALLIGRRSHPGR